MSEKVLSYENPAELKAHLLESYFSKQFSVTQKDIVKNEDMEGLTTRAYLIKGEEHPLKGKILKINHDPTHLTAFSTNVAILKKLRNLHIQITHEGKKPFFPYIYESGTFEGKPAVIEEFIPQTSNGINSLSHLKKLGLESTVLFTKNTLSALAQLQFLDIYQIDTNLQNFAFLPGDVTNSMIDFGFAYSPETRKWNSEISSPVNAYSRGVHTFSSAMASLFKDLHAPIEQKFFKDTSSNPMRYPSYSSILEAFGKRYDSS